MASPLNVTDSNGYVHGYCWQERERESKEEKKEEEEENRREPVSEILSNYFGNIWLVEDIVSRATYALLTATNNFLFHLFHPIVPFLFLDFRINDSRLINTHTVIAKRGIISRWDAIVRYETLLRELNYRANSTRSDARPGPRRNGIFNPFLTGLFKFSPLMHEQWNCAIHSGIIGFIFI